MEALITGGTKGIGRAVALALAADGARVHLGYRRDHQQAETTAEDVRQAGGTPHLLPGDVTDPAVIREHIDRMRDVGVAQLDLLLHGAVGAVQGSPSDLDHATFDRAVRMNGVSLFTVVREALELLGEGSAIVYLSSQGATRAIRGYFGLGAPKALAEATMRYLALDLAPRGIGCFTVTPGALPTEAFAAQFDAADKVLAAAQRANPVGRPVSFEDVVTVVRMLASGDAMMATGSTIHVDGALHLRG